MLLCLAGFACSGAQDANKISIVSKAALEIERTVVMPEGADTLDLYSRYYALSTINEREVIIGTFVAFELVPNVKRTPISELSGAYFIDGDKDLIWFNDGGCGVVTVFFDLKTNQLATFTKSGIVETPIGVCNGVA